MADVPEVRQCQDPEDPQFGAVAVKTELANPWGVMTVRNGGHYANDAEVETWKVLK